MNSNVSGETVPRTAHTRASLRLALAALSMAALLAPTVAAADPCEVVDNGTGTVTLPPAGCEYLSPDEVHLIIDGLPAGTTIELAPIHKNFICYENPTCTILLPPGTCEAPGGALGGNGDCFDSELQLEVTGTGLLAGFNRVLSIPLATEVHTGPRNPGDPVQTFPTEMMSAQGQLFGDPDFDFLQIEAGTLSGLPSPGSTTLTELPNGNFNVDSFFDITYRIDFQGAPGSILEGMAGTTQATIRMQAGQPAGANPCSVPDNGTGTVTLPPEGCEYLSPDDVHMILNNLPPGTTIELAAIHKDFICLPAQGGPPPVCSQALPPNLCEGPGGGLGGNVDCFDSVAELAVTGTGALAGFSRTLFVPLAAEVHTGPRAPGAAVQAFDTEMVSLQGALFGDPDFDQLTITGGSAHGLPSPGHTTLTRLGPPGSDFQVDSFFDITYQIDFQGAPGGALDGLGGSTQGTIRMETGNPVDGVVPTLSEWMSIVLVGLIITGGFAVLLIRRNATS